MSDDAVPRGAMPSATPGVGWLTPVRIALLVWAAMSIVAIVTRWHAIGTLDLGDTDDAMRMAQVRDLLAGQSWWDLHQYRVNPAGGGVLMHWSRIVDAPLAVGILLLEPLLGRSLAETVVMALWPPILGALLSVAVVRGYRDLSDRRIAYVAPLFLICAVFIVGQFRPLRVDHHGWQILLAMLVMAQALRSASGQAGVIAGLSAAALLAISIEGLPIVALFAGLAALRWALYGRPQDRARLGGYMAALASGAIAFQFATRGPSGLIGPWCDSLSAPYIMAFLVAAVAVLALLWIDPKRFMARIAGLGGAAVLAAVALVWTTPDCAAGPFASLDPIVVKYWYRRVLEGQPLWVSPPHMAIYVLWPSLVGLIGSILAWRAAETTDERRDWTTVIAALFGATLLSLLVMRSASTAHLFALPGCAWLGLRLWERARTIASLPPRVLASAAAALSLPLVGSAAMATVLGTAFPALKEKKADQEASVARDSTCLDPAAIAALNREPTGVLMTPIDLGAPLIFWTPHAMVATGHHRNKEAMADTLHFFLGDPARAEALARKQRATLVVFCRTAPDFRQYREARKDGIAALLYANRPPEWLEPVATGSRSGLSMWRVKPARADMVRRGGN